MTELNLPRRARVARRVSRLGAAGVVIALATVAGCNTDKLLKVTDIDVVSPEALAGK